MEAPCFCPSVLHAALVDGVGKLNSEIASNGRVSANSGYPSLLSETATGCLYDKISQELTDILKTFRQKA